jgi:hypothetical protein
MSRQSTKFLLKQTIPSGKITKIISRVIEASRDLSVLLRDARTTGHEIKDEPNPRKRDELDRARASAIEILMRMHRNAEKRDALSQLDPRIRNFVEDLKARNRRPHRKRLPKPKGGRPFGNRVKRLKHAIKIHEAIEARGKKRGSVEAALNEVADCLGVSYEYLREIHYDRDPEWRRDVRAELGRMKWEATVPFSPALWFWEVEFDPLRDL